MISKSFYRIAGLYNKGDDWGKMISWIVIVILLIVGIVAIKMNHLRHRFFIILLIGLALFLYVTIMVVNKQNELDFSDTQGVFHALDVYVGWLANGFQNTKAIGGNAIKMDWKSTNGTFFDKDKKESKKGT